MFHPKKGVNRVQRAQLLKKRRGAGNSTGDETAGLDLEVGPVCTLICAVLIVALGAAMAVAFFAIQKPDCMKNLGLDRASLLRGAFSSSNKSN